MRNSAILAARVAVGLAVIPVLIYSYASGPDPRLTGAPGDDPAACLGCHVGTPLNGGGGSVQITSSAGASYTPGQQQTFTITINDSKAKVYGCQMTARLDSEPVNGQAGDFTAGPQQIVICNDGSLKKPTGCAANQPIQFIEHSHPFQTNVIQVSWTAPSSNVGPVTIYLAVNAANGDANDTGDHIYTTKLQLCPGSACAAALPVISSGGVASAGGFSAKAGVAAGTWLEIFGNNLSSTTRVWAGSDFNGVTAPSSLDGVGVTIGGKNAYVDYVSPSQVNVQVPDGIPIGSDVPLILSNSGGHSAVYPLQTSDLAPALLAPSQAPFNVNGKQYVTAQLPDQSFAGIPSHPAKPGDLLTIYGIGFGPVSPAIAAGTIAPASTSLSNKPTFLLGQTAAAVSYAGLAPGLVGLYQFNLTVPNVPPADYSLTVQTGSVTANQSLFITVGQ